MLILVTNQRKNTYPYRRELYSFGLRFENRKWRIKTSDSELIEQITGFCRRNRLHCECIADSYVRNTTYRKAFLNSYETHNGYYRCAYCGKKITERQMSVDHIIPVYTAQRSQIIRWFMRLSSIRNINDTSNLTPSCDRCNKRKSTKINLYYYIRGMLGKNYTSAAAVHYFLTAAVVFIIISAFSIFGGIFIF